MQVPSGIFREYDIRGLVDKELTLEIAFHLGRAIGSLVYRSGGRRVIVGRDCRKSGLLYSEQLIKGFCLSGCTTIDIGTVPTPINYWGIMHLNADGGVQVTGSHNPPEYNGFKINVAGNALFGDAIQEIRTLIEEENYVDGEGQTYNEPILDNYVHELRTLLKPAGRAFKVVVDAGNGTGGIAALPLYKALGYEVVPMYCDMDGSFPNHHPDPTVEENIAELRQRVLDEGADLGLAFDGDADRLGVIDNKGEVVWGDRVLIILARSILEEVPGARILGEVKCSSQLFEDIRKNGGVPLMGRTGHSLIKARMKKEPIELAGEMSGHFFMSHRYYGFDDAIYTGGRLLEYLSHHKKSIREQLSNLPPVYTTPEIRFDCLDTQKFALVAKMIAHFHNHAEEEKYKIITIDGARVEWEDGFGLVRASNTQPALVMRFEAISQDRLNIIREQFETLLEKFLGEMK
jgi:phosphomannomutase/phosphoglucomutase